MIDRLKKTGVDELVKKHLSDGKPFKKCSKQILEEHPELNIAAIDNSQAIFVENRQRRDFSLQ